MNVKKIFEIYKKQGIFKNERQFVNITKKTEKRYKGLPFEDILFLTVLKEKIKKYIRKIYLFFEDNNYYPFFNIDYYIKEFNKFLKLDEEKKYTKEWEGLLDWIYNEIKLHRINVSVFLLLFSPNKLPIASKNFYTLYNFFDISKKVYIDISKEGWIELEMSKNYKYPYRYEDTLRPFLNKNQEFKQIIKINQILENEFWFESLNNFLDKYSEIEIYDSCDKLTDEEIETLIKIS